MGKEATIPRVASRSHQFAHFMVVIITQLTVTEQSLTFISFCCYYNPILSSFMMSYWVEKRVIPRVPLVEQELITLSDYLSSPPVVFVLLNLQCSMQYFIYHCHFFSFGHCIDCHSIQNTFDYPFGIFKLFLRYNSKGIC